MVDDPVEAGPVAGGPAPDGSVAGGSVAGDSVAEGRPGADGGPDRPVGAGPVVGGSVVGGPVVGGPVVGGPVTDGPPGADQGPDRLVGAEPAVDDRVGTGPEGTDPAPRCLFCAIVSGAHPADHVIDSGPVRAFLDHRPIFPGHTLVVPALHVDNLNTLPPELLEPFWSTVQRVSRALMAPGGLGAQGTFTATNTVVSQSVPHLHVHVVPRRRRDGLRGFFWPRGRYGSEAEAAEIAARIRSAVGATP